MRQFRNWYISRQNDLETVLPFVLLSGFYITTNPALATAKIVFRTFTISRFIHTISYVFAVSRILAYVISNPNVCACPCIHFTDPSTQSCRIMGSESCLQLLYALLHFDQIQCPSLMKLQQLPKLIIHSAMPKAREFTFERERYCRIQQAK